MKGLHYQVAKILESEDLSFWQKLNSFPGRRFEKSKVIKRRKYSYFRGFLQVNIVVVNIGNIHISEDFSR